MILAFGDSKVFRWYFFTPISTAQKLLIQFILLNLRVNRFLYNTTNSCFQYETTPSLPVYNEKQKQKQKQLMTNEFVKTFHAINEYRLIIFFCSLRTACSDHCTFIHSCNYSEINTQIIDLHRVTWLESIVQALIIDFSLKESDKKLKMLNLHQHQDF